MAPQAVNLTSAALRLIFDNSLDGILFSAPDGTIIAANDAATDILRMSPEEIFRRGRAGLADPTDDRWESAVRQRAATGRTRSDLRFRRGDGEVFTAEVSSSIFADEEGNPRACVIFRDVTVERNAAQASQELASLHAVSDVVSLHRSLTMAVSRGGGSAAIAETLRNSLGASVLVDDLEGTVSATVAGEEVDPREFSSWREHPNALHASAYRTSGWLTAVVCPEGELLGAIGVHDPDGRLGQAADFAIEQAANVLAMELFRRRGVVDAELRVWGDLATEWLEGGHIDRTRLHAKNIGYDIDRPHRAIVVQSHGASVGALTTAVRRGARLMEFEANLMVQRAVGVVLLVAETTDWREFAKILRRQSDMVCRIGVGDAHQPPDLNESVAEAELALRLSGDDVALFENLGIWRFLGADAETGRMTAFVNQWIGPLADYDASHGTELVTTLSTYLRRQGALEATATELHVHPSTMKYRIRRIREVTGFDLRDPDQRFNLEVACRSLEVQSLLSSVRRDTVRSAGT